MGMVFIGGVHAVGKGTLCNCLWRELGIQTYSSSKLIESARNLTFSSDKNTNVVSANQAALISMVQEKKALGQPFLLDGHFCLKGTNGVKAIPENVFLEIAPDAVIVLVAKAEIIQQRRKERDGVNERLEEITNFQKLELSEAKLIATKLRIPFLQANALEDYDNIKKFICNVIAPSLS